MENKRQCLFLCGIIYMQGFVSILQYKDEKIKVISENFWFILKLFFYFLDMSIEIKYFGFNRILYFLVFWNLYIFLNVKLVYEKEIFKIQKIYIIFFLYVLFIYLYKYMWYIDMDDRYINI